MRKHRKAVRGAPEAKCPQCVARPNSLKAGAVAGLIQPAVRRMPVPWRGRSEGQVHRRSRQLRRESVNVMYRQQLTFGDRI